MQFRFNKKTLTILIVLLAGLATGVIIGGFFAFTHDLPQIRSLESFRPHTVTRIFSVNKVLLDEIYLEKRDPVPLKQIPHYLRAALVATEDRKFYNHSGVDVKGIARAIVKDIKAGKFVEGASTITQQLAKTLFLTSRKSIVRKIKEAILAFQLERRYTKDEILELYLNQVYFGSGAYGVASAAGIFFGKSVQDLSLAESALIAGMPKSPSRYSPLVNKELALKRRNIVLKQMRDTDIITADEYDRAVKEEINPHERQKSIRAPYFVEYVKNSLEDILGASMLYKGGLSIYTTLDYGLQQSAEKAVIDGLRALEMRMEKNSIEDGSAQAALVAVGVKSGDIKAMVGGRDFGTSVFNRATSARRQPGSAFKPLVYAYAIEQGFAQNQTLLDAPIVFKGASRGDDWRPQNFSETYLGEITLRKALAISQNIPAVRLIETLGPSSVARFAHRLGIESNLDPNLSLALGTSEVTLLNLTSAYAVFARGGEWIEPYGILEVTDHRERVVWSAKPQRRLAMTREGAAVITDMLEGVIKEGTGRKALSLQGPLAGKTGTTDNYHDALFVGFSPAVAAGVWIGRDEGGTMGDKETGSRAALPIWMNFMATALADGSHRYFDFPDNVSKVYIDPDTGKRAADGSKGAVTALFKKGTEPK
ncbi:MAG: PBP1A family penicillin-binding protein [Desulfobacteraceae bacterium]|jgi:penicillin-binding protein 1A|nr:PBP1A family penicillin-binding protein [Desulfobacteraceae bacterium]